MARNETAMIRDHLMAVFVSVQLCDITENRALGAEYSPPHKHFLATAGFSWLWLRPHSNRFQVLGIAKGAQRSFSSDIGRSLDLLPRWGIQRGDCIGWHSLPHATPFGFYLGGATTRWLRQPLPRVGSVIQMRAKTLRTYAVRLVPLQEPSDYYTSMDFIKRASHGSSLTRSVLDHVPYEQQRSLTCEYSVEHGDQFMATHARPFQVVHEAAVITKDSQDLAERHFLAAASCFHMQGVYVWIAFDISTFIFTNLEVRDRAQNIFELSDGATSVGACVPASCFDSGDIGNVKHLMLKLLLKRVMLQPTLFDFGHEEMSDLRVDWYLASPTLQLVSASGVRQSTMARAGRAFVTYVSFQRKEYQDSAIVLGFSLQQHAPGVLRIALLERYGHVHALSLVHRLLTQAGWHVEIVPARSVNTAMPWFYDGTFAKIESFRLPLDEIVYLDADTWVRSGEILQLFGNSRREPLAMVRDCGSSRGYNSGVFVARPNWEKYSKIDAYVSAGFNDQQAINWAYSPYEIYTLAPRFNVHGSLIRQGKVAANDAVVVHFAGYVKPAKARLHVLDDVQTGSTARAGIDGGGILYTEYFNAMISLNVFSFLSPNLQRTLARLLLRNSTAAASPKKVFE